MIGRSPVSIVTIHDGQDARLADYAGVREPARLRDRGLLMAEGRFVVRRLLRSTRLSVRSLLLNPAALESLSDVVETLPASIDVYVAAPGIITTATGFDMHRGCLAVAERPAPASADTLLTQCRFVVVLERVADPDNVGSIFRASEAFGVDAVLLSPGCADPFYRKAIRTSSGAALMVPFADAEPWPDALDRLRDAGFTIAAMTPDRSATAIGAFAASAAAIGRVAIVFGTEGAGLTGDVRARVDVCVQIPMSGALDSLNVAAAAGIALHRLHERRQL